MVRFIPHPDTLLSPRGRSDTAAVMATRRGRPPAEAAVVIVGGGLAALSLTSALWHHGVRDVVCLERTGRIGGQFFSRVDTLKQAVLRSPYDHHPGVEGFRDCELLDFARLKWASLTAGERCEVRMAQAGHRSVVPLDIFEDFCGHVAAVHGVSDRTWTATVQAIMPERAGVLVESDAGTVAGRHVVLCAGETVRPAPSAWWSGDTPPPQVVYWDSPVPPGAGTLAVIGAGLSAAHVIVNALHAGRFVRWIVRGRERFQCADVNASFFRAEGRARFTGTAWAERLALYRSERTASIMFEFRPALQEAEESGILVVSRGRDIRRIGKGPRDDLAIELSDGEIVAADAAVLALGTVPITGAGLLPEAVVNLQDGWPDLEASSLAFRREPRVHLVGAGASMVLGPAARNIDGHRVGTARVAATIARSLAASGRVDDVAVAERPRRG